MTTRWLVASGLCATLLLAWRAAPPMWLRLRLLYWQHQCMQYTPSSAQPVLQSDGKRQGFLRGVVPRPWSQFMNLLTQGSARTTATVFVHERTSPNGHRRLVGVNLLAHVAP
ncbi:MAG TPA: hypothetical protein VLI90_13070, partial [Tepidisphaeraceae bacterium]|nr:hypothetical protein [Tepidisphaeraceae bacterium]